MYGLLLQSMFSIDYLHFIIIDILDIQDTGFSRIELLEFFGNILIGFHIANIIVGTQHLNVFDIITAIER